MQVASADVSMVEKAIDFGFVPVSLNPLTCNKTWNLDVLCKFLFLHIFDDQKIKLVGRDDNYPGFSPYMKLFRPILNQSIPKKR